MELKKLKEIRIFLKEAREDRVRGLTRAGILSSFHSEESYLVQAVNELWDLVCDIASRRLEEDINNTAKKMIEEAKEVL